MLRKITALGMLVLLLALFAGNAVAYDGRRVELNEMGVSFVLPQGWTEENEPDYRAFQNPERDLELDFWLLDDENGMALSSLYASAAEQHGENAQAFRNLETLQLDGLECLCFVDEIGQFCAHIPRPGKRTLYMSLSDNGTGSELFRGVLQSIVLLPGEAEQAAPTDKPISGKLERAAPTDASIPGEAAQAAPTDKPITVEAMWTAVVGALSLPGTPTALPVLERATPTSAPLLERKATPTPAPTDTPSPTREPVEVDTDYEEEPAAEHFSDDDWNKCGVCYGTGRCYPCGGHGWRYAHGDRVDCAACKGTGRCRTCGGDGVK